MEYIDKIIEIVCKFEHIEPTDLHLKTRRSEIVQARQRCMFFLKNFAKVSLHKIGEVCGGKDHSTVIHSCKMVKNHMETEKDYANEMFRIECKIRKLSRGKEVRKINLSDRLREISGYTHRIHICIALNELRLSL